MLAISKALHNILVQAPDLPAALLACAEGLKARIASRDTATKAFEVAQVLEHCDPDRSRALAAYVICWKSDPGRLDALSRARHLGRELGDFVTSAKLAHLQHRQDPDHALLVFEGNAWLDAGEPDRAVKPLLAAWRALPGDEPLALALATARREWSDVRGQIETLRRTAAEHASGAESAELLLQAARMLRMLQTNDREVEACLLDAFERDPENLSALGLLEGRLDTLVGEARFMQICERRFQSRQSPRETVEELRRAGTRLVHSPRFHGLGIRLLQRSLDHAYESRLEDVPGHVATLSLLGHHARASHLHSEFLELIDRGLALALSEIDHGVMAIQALDIAWRHSVDEEAARTYAAIATALAPRHPLVIEATQQGLDADFDDEQAAAFRLIGDADEGPVPAPVVIFEESQGLELGPERDSMTEATLIRHLESIEEPPTVADAAAGAPLELADEDLQLVDDEPPTMVDFAATEAEPTTIGPPEAGDLELLGGEPPALGDLYFDEPPLTASEVADSAHQRRTAPMPAISFPPAPPRDEAPREGRAGLAAAPPVAEPSRPETAREPLPPRSLAAPRPTPPVRSPAPPRRPSEISLADQATRVAGDAPARAVTLPSLIPNSAIKALRHATEARKAAQNAPAERAFRLVIPLSCEVLGATGRSHASLRDISVTGLFLLVPSGFVMGQTLDLELSMPRDSSMMQTDKFLTRVRIARHVADTGYGAAFVAPAPAFVRRIQALIEGQAT